MTIFCVSSAYVKRISFLLAISLGCAGAARSQAAAEFRPHPVDSKEWPKQAVRASHGMVATDEQLGSQAGVEILKRGGNAVDAAVAVAFALAVVEPAAGNIGGGGFMLVRLADGRSSFFDYREVAPGKATRSMYIGPDGKLIPNDNVTSSVIGYRSIAVPGTVAGLELALKTYGTMKLADVLAPAIRLAENGYPVSEKLAHEFFEEESGLEKVSNQSAHFPERWTNDATAGNTLRQPELAATLKRIAKNGAAEFYTGDTARAVVDDITKNGGLITLDDLASYKPKVREVLHAQYTANDHDGVQHSWDVLTSPPPSSGGVAIIEAMNMQQSTPLKGWDDVESVPT